MKKTIVRSKGEKVMAETKTNKREVLAAIKAVAEAGTDFAGVPAEDVISFVDTSIAQLDAKAESSRKRAEAKRAEGDALRGVIAGFVTDVPTTIDDITAAVQGVDGYAEVTKSQVTARLTQLNKLGKVEKSKVKAGDRTLVAYSTAVEE